MSGGDPVVLKVGDRVRLVLPQKDIDGRRIFGRKTGDEALVTKIIASQSWCQLGFDDGASDLVYWKFHDVEPVESR